MKTAIDNYSLGKQKEIQAESFERGNKFPLRRFTCPECGEDVFWRPSKYSKHFSHYQKTEKTAECDRRSDGNSSLTIYERLGLPLYLRINNNKFNLNIGFRYIPLYLLKRATEEKVYMKINAYGKNGLDEVKYLINQDRFYSDRMTYIEIDFIPIEEQRYNISFSKSDIVKPLKQIWSDYIDGFSKEGALFTSNEYGGKKIRHGDSISVNKEYYWVRKGSVKRIPGIEMELFGELKLKYEKYNVFKGRFNSSILNENHFKNLAEYLRKEMKIFLLEKQPEIMPLWPPCIRVGDSYNIHDSGKRVFCNIISPNNSPKVFMYNDNKNDLSELNTKSLKDENSITSFNLFSDRILINVDRKIVSTGSYFEYKELELYELENEIIEIENNDYRNITLLHETRGNKELKLQTLTYVDLIRVDRKGNIIKSKSSNKLLEITELNHKDKIYILSHNRLIYSANIERNVRENSLNQIDDNKLCNFLRKHNNDIRVIMPLTIRKVINEMLISCNTSKIYLQGYLEKNTIPIAFIYWLGGNENVR